MTYVIGELKAVSTIVDGEVQVRLICTEHGNERHTFSRGEEQLKIPLVSFATACRNAVLDLHKEEHHGSTHAPS